MQSLAEMTPDQIAAELSASGVVRSGDGVEEGFRFAWPAEAFGVSFRRGITVFEQAERSALWAYRDRKKRAA